MHLLHCYIRHIWKNLSDRLLLVSGGAANAAFRFAAENEPCNIVYRANIKGEYWIIHARGEYIYSDPDVRLGIVWFANEGRYVPDPSGNGSDSAQTFSKVIPGETLNYKNYYDSKYSNNCI